MSKKNLKDYPRRVLIVGFWVLLYISCDPKEKRELSGLPNIVIIFADDMGYGDVSALNPSAKTRTPAIDNLIQQGLAFTEAHASASVCTPSRYGLLTGRYAFRSENGAYGIWGFDKPVIEPERKTLARLLKKSGYQTACIGKWHLGLDWQTKDGSGEPNFDEITGYSDVDYHQPVSGGPNDFGFDYSFIHPASLDIPPYVFLRNQEVVDPDMILTTDFYPSRKEDTEYAWDKKHTNDDAVYWEKGVWWRQGEMSRSFRIETCQTEIVKEGVAFIERASENPENPFFLYLPLTSPHTPWVPSEKFKGTSSVGLYGDFIREVDDVVAQVINALKKHGTYENTLFVFTSDNGAYWPQEEIDLHNHDANQGRRGQKGDIWDGGHRVPLVISWPGMTDKPGMVDHLISLTDFYATFAALTGSQTEAGSGEDSFSFWHVLNGDFDTPIRPSMIHHSSRGMYSIRGGGWKYIEGLGSGGFTFPDTETPLENGPQGQLYRVEVDSLEQNNLFSESPEQLQELKEKLERGKRKGETAS
ncbi:sulfatase family protein [Negadavirga shengliensis]|uniref:sulfatase family protein n=1 Tax=Negadavirga shengliensis TaxID=1389218 RepID=UPI00366CA310